MQPSASTGIEFWIAFNAVVLVLIALDLGVFHRHARAMKMSEAAGWSAFWIALAMGFNYVILVWQGQKQATDFLLGYLMEKSLSVDNLFVFVMIFTYFNVSPAYQRRVLSLGILGALLMRAAFIFLGAAALHTFHFMIYVFGVFLVWTGIKMLFHEDEEIHPERNPVVRWFRRIFPVATDYEGPRFLLRRNGTLVATPLLVVLIVVETSDVVFAVDSIPAIFGVTQDPFIVYTSNVCAILGLRALYFLLAGAVNIFRYLKFGISIVLVFIGLKMMLTDWWPIDSGTSLMVVGGILGVAFAASLLNPGAAVKDGHGPKEPPGAAPGDPPPDASSQVPREPGN